MKIFEEPVIRIRPFTVEDVIASSGGGAVITSLEDNETERTK